MWDKAKALYVEGEPPAREGDPHHFPTLEEVASRVSVRHDTLRKRSGREGWATERRRYSAMLEQKKREAKTAKLAAEAASFDNTTFALAKAIAGEVAQSLRDINRVRQLRDLKIRQAEGDDEELLRVMTQANLIPAGAHRLSALAGTLNTAQRVGRLALGDVTENVNHTGKVDADLTVEGEIKAVHDFREDPKMVAMVAKALKDAGIHE